jgi:predicted dehydrogenase
LDRFASLGKWIIAQTEAVLQSKNPTECLHSLHEKKCGRDQEGKELPRLPIRLTGSLAQNRDGLVLSHQEYQCNLATFAWNTKRITQLPRAKGGRIPGAKLHAVVDVNVEAARRVAAELGCAAAGNKLPTEVTLHSADSTLTDKPLHFFLERYEEAYLAEMREFIRCIRENQIPPVGGLDGRISVAMGYAALESMASGNFVQVK